MPSAIIAFFALTVIVSTCSAAAAAADNIEVDTSLGKVLGTTLTSRLGAKFYAFRGLRYAEPPIDELRFRNPRAVRSWAPKVYDATLDGPMCPQSSDNLTDVSEDCLRLNVYTKDLNASKPVIIYIHPGGFYSVSGQSKNFAGPQHFMDRDVVLVTINYRLGTLGFLATNSAAAPGNAGLKDQVMAMRWVQEHIEKFGGNAKSVTLLGYSAGSLSIGLHMLSPMAKGLFHRGIAMSASPLGQWNYPRSDMHLAQRQARLLRCPETPAKALEDCLRQKPMLDFVRTQPDMFDFGWNPVLNWLPVIETDYGQERFLIEHPMETVTRGDFYKVPLITGITEFEFISGAYWTLVNETITRGFNEDFQHYAPIALLYERDTPRSHEISSIFREKYLQNKNLSLPDSLESYGELLSDALIGFEYHRFLTLMAQHTPVYTYLFTYKGRYSHFNYPPESNQTYGAVHHDELLYLLHVPVLTPLFSQNDPENELIERITRMWTEFAYKSDPNNPEDPYLKELQWKLYTAKKKEYLEIGAKSTLKTGGFYQERYRLWDELFPVNGFRKQLDFL